MIQAVRSVVHDGATPDEAFELLRELPTRRRPPAPERGGAALADGEPLVRRRGGARRRALRRRAGARSWRCASTRAGCSAPSPTWSSTAAATPRSRARPATSSATSSRRSSSRPRGAISPPPSRRTPWRWRRERARRLAGSDDPGRRRSSPRACAPLCSTRAPTPSIEAPVHAVMPGRYVDHTHADAMLALTNRPDGEAVVRRGAGRRGARPALRRRRACRWPGRWPRPSTRCRRTARRGGDGLAPPRHRHLGRDRRDVLRADDRARPGPRGTSAAERSGGRRRPRRPRAARVRRGRGRGRGPRWARRGAGAARPASPRRRAAIRTARGGAVVLRPRTATPRRSALLARRPDVARLAAGGPLTADHLIRTGLAALAASTGPSRRGLGRRPATRAGGGGRRAAGPLRGLPSRRHRLDAPAEACGFASANAPTPRHRDRLPAAVEPRRRAPVVLLPGCGVVAAARRAKPGSPSTSRSIRSRARRDRRRRRAATGPRRGAPVRMEYRPLQHAKLARGAPAQGAALLARDGGPGHRRRGCDRHWCVPRPPRGGRPRGGDRPRRRARSKARGRSWRPRDPGRVLGGAAGRHRARPGGRRLRRRRPGLGGRRPGGGQRRRRPRGDARGDELADFARLERINVHGTLLVLAEAARLLRRQGTGGDVVLISTKNVFAPGA